MFKDELWASLTYCFSPAPIPGSQWPKKLKSENIFKLRFWIGHRKEIPLTINLGFWIANKICIFFVAAFAEPLQYQSFYMWVLILMNSSRGFLEFSSYLRLKSKTAGMPIKWQAAPYFQSFSYKIFGIFRNHSNHQVAATQNLVYAVNNVYTCTQLVHHCTACTSCPCPSPLWSLWTGTVTAYNTTHVCSMWQYINVVKPLSFSILCCHSEYRVTFECFSCGVPGRFVVWLGTNRFHVKLACYWLHVSSQTWINISNSRYFGALLVLLVAVIIALGLLNGPRSVANGL